MKVFSTVFDGVPMGDQLESLISDVQDAWNDISAERDQAPRVLWLQNCVSIDRDIEEGGHPFRTVLTAIVS